VQLDRLAGCDTMVKEKKVPLGKRSKDSSNKRCKLTMASSIVSCNNSVKNVYEMEGGAQEKSISDETPGDTIIRALFEVKRGFIPT
jgi:hypothetical protein